VTRTLNEVPFSAGAPTPLPRTSTFSVLPSPPGMTSVFSAAACAASAAAEAEGMDTIAFLDQTYFLMGLLDALPDPQSAIRNPQLKTLIVPGGLGSTLKVLILGKGVGKPALKGCSFKVRAT